MEKLYGFEQCLQRLVWSVHSITHSLNHSVNPKRDLISIKLCKILPFEVGLILRSNCLFCDIHRDSKLCKFSGNLKSTLDSVLATFLFATLEATHTGSKGGWRKLCLGQKWYVFKALVKLPGAYYVNNKPAFPFPMPSFKKKKKKLIQYISKVFWFSASWCLIKRGSMQSEEDGMIPRSLEGLADITIPSTGALLNPDLKKLGFEKREWLGLQTSLPILF